MSEITSTKTVRVSKVPGKPLQDCNDFEVTNGKGAKGALVGAVSGGVIGGVLTGGSPPGVCGGIFLGSLIGGYVGEKAAKSECEKSNRLLERGIDPASAEDDFYLDIP